MTGPFEFAGRTAVVTGAAAGIGRALALALARKGVNLVLADLDLTRAQAVAAQAEDLGIKAVARKVDVSKADEVEALAVLADETFGGADLLFNNAGIMTPDRMRPVWEFSVEEWRAMFDVNILSVIHGLRSFVPRMLACNRDSYIVNTASAAGLISGAISVPYSVSKHAVVRISEGVYAAMQSRGAPIGVSVVCPGLVRTEIYDRSGPQPETDDTGFAFDASTLEPDALAEMMLEGVRNRQFYIITTDAFDPQISARAEAVLNRRNPDFLRISPIDAQNNR